MKISDVLKKKINSCVVRIIAEDININWNIPYLLDEPSKGQGTGFFINKKGYILTCAHVVNGSKNLYIEIPFLGSDKYQCEVLSIVPHFDIALIRTIDYKPSCFVELGNSDKLVVGTEVQVVGYPVSFSSSSNNSNNLKFTTGIISGQQKGLIQTDSAINPGNSGGPLFCNNKVIGINNMKLVGESLENIGYSIPINYYKIIEKNINQKIIYRPNLLFEYNNTNKHILKDLTNGKVEKGIIVSKILKGSPLENTNIKKDTIITGINDYSLDNYGLTDNYKWFGTNINIDILLNKFKNDEVITIKYFQDGKIATTKVKLFEFVSPIRIMYPVFEEISYFIIGGMIFMNFCGNHILNINNSNLNLLCSVMNSEESLKEKLYLSFVFPNSSTNILNNLHTHDFISKVNNINVCNIDSLKKALKKPLIINNKKIMKFEEENGKSILLEVDEIIKQNKVFSNTYKYPIFDF